MDLFDLQYSDCMDELQYELYMEELNSEEAFQPMTPATSEAMVVAMAEEEPEPPAIIAVCVDVIRRYAERADTIEQSDALYEKMQKVELVGCTAVAGGLKLTAKAQWSAMQSKTYDVQISDQGADAPGTYCTCFDSTYRPAETCKHRAALAARWLGQL